MQRDDERRDPQEELDDALDVASWRLPSGRSVREQRGVDDNAPTWWQGDEEASQSFLSAMGVQLQ